MLQEKYTAFISYRHQSPDAEIAKKLHTLIEGYRIPARIAKAKTSARRMGRVFRDSEELPLSPDLGKDIENALDSSEWFIAVCSPRYLESLWCMRELEYFMEKKGREHILTVLVEGEPKDSFPRKLVFAEDGTPLAEPLAADVRGSSLRAHFSRLKSEKLRLLAPMLGVKYDELYRRQTRRRIRNILLIAGATVAALAAFLVYAFGQNARIEEQRVTASRNECDLMVEKSLYYTSENRKGEARDLALQALEVSENTNGYNSSGVFDALAKATYSGDFDAITSIAIPGDFAESFSYSPDDSKIMMTGGGEIAVCDAATGERLWTQAPARQQLTSAHWSPDSRTLVITSTSSHGVYLLDAESGVILHQLYAPWATEAVYDGKSVYVVCSQGFLRWNPETDETEILEEGGINQTPAAAVNGPFLAMQPDIFEASVQIIDTRTGAVRSYVPESKAMVEPFVPSPEGDRLFIHQWNKDFVADLNTGDVLWEVSLESSEDGYTQKACWFGNTVCALSRAYDAETGKLLFTYDGEALGLTADGRFLISSAGLYSMSDGSRYSALSGSICAADHSGKHLLIRGGSEAGWTAVMPGQGSQRLAEDYTGSLLRFDNWNAPLINSQLQVVNQVNDFMEGSQNTVTASRMGFTPDHRYGVLVGDGISIKIWDADYGENVKYRIYGYTDPIPVGDFCFSKDSRLLAIAGGYGKVGVYDLETGTTLHLWKEQYMKQTLTGICFNGDGTLLMTEARYAGIYTVYSVKDGLILYRIRADSEVNDWGFDTETGDAVLIYTDGTARIADIFTSLEELRAWSDNRTED